MPEKHRRYFLRDKDTKALCSQILPKLKVDLGQLFSSKADFEVVEIESAEIFLINGRPLLARTEGNTFPTLVFNEFSAVAPRIVVDMGAIPYMCRGANVMAPGIRRFEGEFKKGDFTLIVDEKHGKSLAIGETLYDLENAKKVKQGVVIKNLHFVGDRIWNFIKCFAVEASRK